MVIGEIDSHYFLYYTAYSTNLRASSPIPLWYSHFENLNLVIYSILFNSVVKPIDSITCHSDLLFREANGSAIQVISLWKIKSGLLLNHHTWQPNTKAAKKSQGNSLLVNMFMIIWSRDWYHWRELFHRPAKRCVAAMPTL